MKHDDALRKLEGLQTVETAAEKLGIGRQSALNLLSKLKKEQHATVSGAGRRKRIYKITMRKQRPRSEGMFDIINKHSPMKISEWYDHQVHGSYGPEEALVDALQTQSFRAILASMRLFSHITDWPKLYKLAKQKNCWQKVGALHDLAKKYFRVKEIPKSYLRKKALHRAFLIKNYPTKEPAFYPIEKKWKTAIPFRKGDVDRVITG